MADFLAATPEVAALNQYWYSPATIGALVAELESGRVGRRVAFLSTPSLYFSLPADSTTRKESVVFDLDEQWAGGANFRRFDFNDGSVGDDLAGTFDCAVVDPPFITREVWAKYAECIRSALRPGGALLCTTVGENEAALRSVLGAHGVGLRKATFMPAMQSGALPYQYSLFLNYAPHADSPLAAWNGEVPRSFEAANDARMNDEAAGGARAPAAAEQPLGGTTLSFEALLERELAREGRGEAAEVAAAAPGRPPG